MLPGHNPGMRGVRDGVFVSEQLPPLRLRVAPQLRYIGSFTFELTNVARSSVTSSSRPRDPASGGCWSCTSLRDELAESPEAEMAHAASFLEGHGLALPDRQAVARFARVIGEDRRSELLIFYHEIDGAEDGILERAERAFKVTMERS